jgi:murein DD-endopeptidase MepM/ murein hydrolase activator NlpD
MLHPESVRLRGVSRIVLLLLLSGGIAGCSSDFSRTSESPWQSRPQAAHQASPPNGEVTGSVRQPTGRVESAALPPPQASPQVNYGGGAGMGSYQPPQQAAAQPPQYTPTHPPRTAAAPIQTRPARPEYTGSIADNAREPAAAWSWDGGTAIIVAQGETVDSIARRYRVPPGAILQANNMPHAALLQPGQRLVIPRLAAAPQVSAPQTRVAGPAIVQPASHGNGHVVAPGETIYSLARHYRLTPMAIAKANNLTLAQQLRVGQRIIIPGGAGAPRLTMPAQPPVQAAPQQHAARPEALPAVKQQPKVAQVEPLASARVVTPAADPLPESAPTGSANAASFRWPVRGRVIAGFGPKASGGQNDGINVSVPEGTPIKAAEDGVVAYSGNELKGYGNLVLVRHSNGFVTAYAHASELTVKKGEAVKRGQVIGKAGATGNVTSPQLHFEVRKGATPVDPAQYLTGG